MREYEFAVILGTAEESEEDADTLYEAGCADGPISTSAGACYCLRDQSVVS
jgi:hypothetical protein